MQRHRFLLLLILLAGAAIRFYGLGAKSLWFDEALSYRLLQFPLGEMIARTDDPRAVHPPLYFLALRVWSGIWGDSEFALRSLAAVCGVAAILGTYFLMAELSNVSRHDRPSTGDPSAGTAALLAAALIAFSALQIHASKQVRGYSMATALFIWSSWALLCALRPRGRTAYFWGLYALLALAVCYTHHIAVLSVLAQGTFGATYLAVAWYSECRGRSSAFTARQTKYALLAAGVILLGFSPSASTLMRQADTVRSSEISQTTVFDIPQSVFTGLLTTWAEPIPVGPLAVWSFFGILVLVLLLLAARGGWNAWYLVLTGLIPLILAFLFSAFSGRGIVRPRYLTIAQVSWLCSFAMVISRVPFRVERSILICLSLGLSVYSISNAWAVIGPSATPGMREAVQHILTRREPDEPIIARSPYVLFGASYYARGVTRPLLCVSESRTDFKHGSTHLRDDDFISPDDLSKITATGAWVLNTEAYENPERFLCRMPPNWKLKERREFQQDYLWETPVIVEHYEIAPQSD